MHWSKRGCRSSVTWTKIQVGCWRGRRQSNSGSVAFFYLTPGSNLSLNPDASPVARLFRSVRSETQ